MFAGGLIENLFGAAVQLGVGDAFVPDFGCWIEACRDGKFTEDAFAEALDAPKLLFKLVSHPPF